MMNAVDDIPKPLYKVGEWVKTSEGKVGIVVSSEWVTRGNRKTNRYDESTRQYRAFSGRYHYSLSFDSRLPKKASIKCVNESTIAHYPKWKAKQISEQKFASFEVIDGQAIRDGIVYLFVRRSRSNGFQLEETSELITEIYSFTR